MFAEVAPRQNAKLPPHTLPFRVMTLAYTNTHTHTHTHTHKDTHGGR